jgi:hypothetical protein
MLKAIEIKVNTIAGVGNVVVAQTAKGAKAFLCCLNPVIWGNKPHSFGDPQVAEEMSRFARIQMRANKFFGKSQSGF